MKTIFKIFTLTLIALLLNIQTITAQCHIDDWTALKALYESTNGDNWTIRIGWDNIIDGRSNPPDNCNLGELYGVHLDVQERIETLDLSNNELNGSLPEELDNLTSLVWLFLDNNRLSGNLPAELGDLTNLIWLFLSDNELSGSLPTELSNLTNLEVLRLQNNRLSGQIPPELGNLSDLRELFLEKNQLNGSLPPELGNLTNLVWLFLFDNQLNGIVPIELSNLTNLEVLRLDNNRFSGSLPKELGNLAYLEWLFLGDNELNGSVPAEWSNLNNLEVLRLENNRLSGNIPPELGSLTNLRELFLSNNQFNGNLPAELGDLSSLVWLFLSYNQFDGSLPSELCSLNNLSLLDINNNNLQGCYPVCVNTFCVQLNDSYFEGISDISNGNNFDATWEDFCEIGAGACCDEDCETTFVYPGDLNHDGIVNRVDVALLGLYHLEIGPERTEEHQNTDWYAHPATDWNRQHLNSADIKHFNTNGDNVIDDLDHQAVFENMDSIWTNPIPPPPAPTESDYQVMLQPADQVIDGFLLIDVSLERRTGGNLNIQGGHFTIDYSDIDGTISQAILNLDPTPWIGIPGINLTYESKTFIEEKKIEVGFSRSDNVICEGEGIIGRLILQFDNGTSKRRANPVYEFCVNTIGTHNGVDYTLIEDQNLQVDVIGGDCQSNLTISENIPFQNEYKSSNSIETDDFILIGANQKVEYKANERVTLNSGFRVKVGAEFTAEIEPCE